VKESGNEDKMVYNKSKIPQLEKYLEPLKMKAV
jgi:hypothetical protein